MTQHLTPKRQLAIAAIAALLIIVWTQGTFDNFLWRVHLNHNTCGQNGFGAVFCGDALKEYEKSIGDFTKDNTNPEAYFESCHYNDATGKTEDAYGTSC